MFENGIAIQMVWQPGRSTSMRDAASARYRGCDVGNGKPERLRRLCH